MHYSLIAGQQEQIFTATKFRKALEELWNTRNYVALLTCGRGVIRRGEMNSLDENKCGSKY